MSGQTKHFYAFGPFRLGSESRNLAPRLYTPSKVTGNPFGINEPSECTFIPMGGPKAHGNSKPLNERNGDVSTVTVSSICDTSHKANHEQRHRRYLHNAYQPLRSALYARDNAENHADRSKQAR